MFLMRQVEGLPVAVKVLCTILEFLYHKYACYVMVLEVNVLKI